MGGEEGSEPKGGSCLPFLKAWAVALFDFSTKNAPPPPPLPTHPPARRCRGVGGGLEAFSVPPLEAVPCSRPHGHVFPVLR